MGSESKICGVVPGIVILSSVDVSADVFDLETKIEVGSAVLQARQKRFPKRDLVSKVTEAHQNERSGKYYARIQEH